MLFIIIIIGVYYYYCWHSPLLLLLLLYSVFFYMFLIRIISVWLPWLLDPILGCSLSAKSFTLANVVNLSSNPLLGEQMAKNIIKINVNIRQIANSFKQISFIFRPKWCKWLNSREILDGTMENPHDYHWYKGCPTVPHVDPSPPHRQNRRDLSNVVNWLSGSISIMIDNKATNQEIHRNLWEPIWVNYNISLTWIKAILGWFPLLTMIIVRSQWGRYNLPRTYGNLWMKMNPTYALLNMLRNDRWRTSGILGNDE